MPGSHKEDSQVIAFCFPLSVLCFCLLFPTHTHPTKGSSTDKSEHTNIDTHARLRFYPSDITRATDDNFYFNYCLLSLRRVETRRKEGKHERSWGEAAYSYAHEPILSLQAISVFQDFSVGEKVRTNLGRSHSINSAARGETSASRAFMCTRVSRDWNGLSLPTVQSVPGRRLDVTELFCRTMSYSNKGAYNFLDF